MSPCQSRSPTVLVLSLVIVAVLASWPALAGEAASPPPRSEKLAAAFAGASRLYADERLREWSALYDAGEKRELLQRIEADLRGDAPHPMAAYAWAVTKRALGELSPGTAPDVPAELEPALGPGPTVYAFYSAGDYTAALEAVPPKAEASIADLWTWKLLAWSADELGMTTRAVHYARELAQRFPGDFGVAWVAEMELDQAWIANDTAAWLAQHPGVAHTPVGRHIAWVLAHPADDNAQRYANALAWLEHDPGNARALRRKGHALGATQRYDEALVAYRRAEQRFPFYENWKNIGATLIRLRRHDKARAYAETSARRDYPAAEAERVAAYRYGAMAEEAGHRGIARSTWEAALERWPGDRQLLLALARLSLDEGFPAEAADQVRPFVDAHPDDPQAVDTLAEALREQERFEAAFDVVKAYRAAGGPWGKALLYELWKAAREIGRHEAVAAAGEQGEAVGIDDAWVRRFLAVSVLDAGRAGEAYRRLKAALSLNPTNHWYLARLAEAAESTGREAAFAGFLERLQNELPHYEEVWQVAADRAPPGETAAVWDEAIAAVPDRAFPYIQRAEHAEDWQKARAIVSRGIDRLKDEDQPQGQRALLYDRRALIADEAYRKGQTRDEGRLGEALDDLERMRADFGPMGDYWRARYFVLSRTPNTTAMVESLRRWERAKPSSPAWRQFYRGRVVKALNSGMAFEALHRAIARNPRDKDMLWDGQHFHLRWGGSPVVAIDYAERLKREHPGEAVERVLKEAYGRLGAHKEYYLEAYAGNERIGRSGRYVDWFEAARRRAQADAGAVLKAIDTERSAATVLRSDGIEEERRYDPASGKLIFVRVGAATLEIDYTRAHQLKRLTVGETPLIDIDYSDPAPGEWRGRMVAVRIHGEPQMRLVHDEEGRPRRILMEGLGELKVSYDPSTGEVARTEAVRSSDGVRAVDLVEKMTRLMSKFYEYANLLREAKEVGFDDLPFEDPELEALRTKARAQDSTAKRLPAQLAVVRYLLEHLEDRAAYGEEAEAIAHSVFRRVATRDEPAYHPYGVQAAALWRELQTRLRPEGLPIAQWKDWNRMLDWMERLPRDDTQVAKTIAAISQAERLNGLRLLSNGNWLASSYLDNPGYWNRYAAREVLPKALAASARFTALLARANGEIVVGTDRGLSVLRDGYWEWMAFDEGEARWSRNADYTDASTASSVTALTEDAAGRLWIGTETGLILMPADYEGEVQYWRGARAGIPGGRVNALARAGKGVVVAGAGGSRMWSTDGPGRMLPDAAETATASFVQTYPVDAVERGGPDTTSSGAAPTFGLTLIGTRNGLLASRDGETGLLVEGRVGHAYWDREVETLYVLRGETLYRAPYRGGVELEGELLPLPQQETIVHAGRLFGLRPIPVGDGEAALAVLTDQGMSLYRDYHFEHKKVPLSDKTQPVFALDEVDGRIFMLTGDGVASIERGQTRTDRAGRVHDLETDPRLGVTYVARGNRLEAVFHDAPEDGPRTLSHLAATRLALDGEGRLVTNDGYDIVRFDQGSDVPRRLFRAQPTIPEDRPQGELTSLIVASDGTIWATVGSSLFAWREGDEQPEEYSIYIDDDAFPVDSDMLEQVIETRGGEIWVVASDEGHRTWRGKALEGGLFKRTEVGWKRIDGAFVTSYTPVDDEQAVVGTARGFAEHRGGDGLRAFAAMNDVSYEALKQRQPSLHLGTAGARLDDDLWLFGSVAGVVAYRDGTWFYPDRLNWMLPGQELASYGARVVHAVETDAQGRVYVGTDLGLLVYDPLGAGAETFLVSNQRTDYAFQVLEQRKMREVNDVLMKALDPDSRAGRLVARYENTKREMATLERELERMDAGAGDLSAVSTGAAPHAPDEDGERQQPGRRSEALRERLRRKEKAQVALLARLERRNPALFQMLRLDPLDLKALRRDMDTDTVIVQYLPTDEQLYINVVSRDTSELRTVDVSRDVLMRRAETVTRALAAQLERLHVRGAEALAQPAGDEASGSGSTTIATALSHRDTLPALEWLYDKLLRPVEHEIVDADHVLIVPAGKLSYLPFAALVRGRDDAGAEYAVEAFTLGILPTLYTFDLMQRDLPSAAFGHLVFGDSDGTLPGARREAQAIAELLRSEEVETHIGEQATYEALTAHAPNARFVHLAVHGKLDVEAPERSYLQLADGYRLSLTDAMLLPLHETELVFLSACESGLGRNGLEYRTLAQAFAHAGAPTVVATLWEVNDTVARELATDFYRHKTEGADNLDALAAAQRALIEHGGARARPAAWAPFTVFGKP